MDETKKEIPLKGSYVNLLTRGLVKKNWGDYKTHLQACRILTIFKAFDEYVSLMGENPNVINVLKLWNECREEDRLKEIEDKKVLMEELSKEIKNLEA